MNAILLNTAKFSHVMLDWETYALTPWNTGVSSVALLEFNPLPQDEVGALTKPVGACYVTRFEKQPWRKHDPATMKWRAANNLDTLELVLPCVSTYKALLCMAAFCKSICGADKQLVVWAKPSLFDIIIWQSLLDDFSLAQPWFRRNAMCVNTYCTAHGFAPYPLLKKLVAEHDFGTAHDALVDCRIQISMVHACLAAQGETPENNEE